MAKSKASQCKWLQYECKVKSLNTGTSSVNLRAVFTCIPWMPSFSRNNLHNIYLGLKPKFYFKWIIAFLTWSINKYSSIATAVLTSQDKITVQEYHKGENKHNCVKLHVLLLYQQNKDRSVNSLQFHFILFTQSTNKISIKEEASWTWLYLNKQSKNKDENTKSTFWATKQEKENRRYCTCISRDRE